MNAEEVIKIASLEEDSRRPFKADVHNADSLAAEMAAVSRFREELQRLFQDSSLVHADEAPVPSMSLSDLDMDYFKRVFGRLTGLDFDLQAMPPERLLSNMNLLRDGRVNLSCALLFGGNLRSRLPAFGVKAARYPGEDVSGGRYLDSRDFQDKLAVVFSEALSFVMLNLRYSQAGQGVNSLAKPEIDRAVFEELIANALIHRDYFISAPVRIFIFRDRIEIVSPGHLPNNLRVEHIKNGNSNIRNPLLASYATRLIPYRGLGTGIRRALSAYPDIDFLDDREGNLFTAVVRRKPDDQGLS